LALWAHDDSRNAHGVDAPVVQCHVWHSR
jgi:hypothetical protein